jgi:hypothetical protein
VPENLWDCCYWLYRTLTRSIQGYVVWTTDSHFEIGPPVSCHPYAGVLGFLKCKHDHFAAGFVLDLGQVQSACRTYDDCPFTAPTEEVLCLT